MGTDNWNLALNSREWALATLIFALFLIILVASRQGPSPGGSVLTALRSVAAPRILVPIGVLCGWVALATVFAVEAGIWYPEMLKDSIIWFGVSAFATLFAAGKAAKEDHFFRRSALGAVGVVAILQFVFNTHTFSYGAELLIQVLLFLSGLLNAGPVHERLGVPWGQIVRWGGAIFTLGLLFAVVGETVSTWNSNSAGFTTAAFVYSVWLPLAVLPYVWLFGLYMSYEVLLQRLGNPVFGYSAPLKNRIWLVLALGARLRAVNDLVRSPADLEAIAKADTRGEVYAAVRSYLPRRERRRNEAILHGQRLERFAGIRGRNAEGRHLDQRELPETRKALRRLAVYHQNHYLNDGRYRADLLDLIAPFKGLPELHAIHSIVSESGDSWYAWRRTPCGLVLGTGASAPPPDTWLYAGEREPAGPPGSTHGWERDRSSEPDWCSQPGQSDPCD